MAGLILLFSFSSIAHALAPSIYWQASPVSAGDTSLFAGAFGNVTIPTVALCNNADCTTSTPVEASLAHERSVGFSYPSSCAAVGSGGCYFQFCSGDQCVITPDPNAPNVWWASAWPPTQAPGTTFSPGPISPRGDGVTLVRRGDHTLLRVFGRSLAFQPSLSNPTSLECVSPDIRMPNSGTLLDLGVQGVDPVSAYSANCYEASFDLTEALAQASSLSEFPSATFTSPFGHTPLPLAALPARVPAAPLSFFDVEASFNGNVSAALEAAATAVPGDKVVLLGSRTYSFTSSITVPTNTTLVGRGADLSILSFALQPSTSEVPPCVTGSSSWGLQDLSVHVTEAPAGCPAVSHEAGFSNFTAFRVSVVLTQNNVSNAFRLLGTQWDISECSITQAGVCLWPPTSDNTNFPASVALRLQTSSDGSFRNNALNWSCGGLDMDVSQRIVFENCNVTETNAGTFPHGNSISSYSVYDGVPYSQSYLYAHNRQVRPPNNNRTDWGFHETLTTDGPGGWGGGTLMNIEGNIITLGGTGLHLTIGKIAGASAIVIAGPGTGQFRPIAGLVNATSVTLVQPFDDHVVLGESVIVVQGTVGGKIVADNTFIWGSVVQEFGITLTGVFSGNNFDHQNNAMADAGDIDGSLTGFGLCYSADSSAPEPLFFVEYRGNVMSDSNGIALHDVYNNNCNTSWPGPYIKWVTIVNNSISGIAPSANPGMCGTINATNPQTSDLLVERNSFGCAAGDYLACGNGLCIGAANSVVR
jgi:hypothetical protein